MSTNNLLSTVSNLTGLPHNSLKKELDNLAKKAGYSPDQLSMDQLREIMSEYLQTVLLEAKNQFSA